MIFASQVCVCCDFSDNIVCFGLGLQTSVFPEYWKISVSPLEKYDLSISLSLIKIGKQHLELLSLFSKMEKLVSLFIFLLEGIVDCSESLFYFVHHSQAGSTKQENRIPLSLSPLESSEYLFILSFFSQN